jgi:riboflavin biosynthesis pyrimidine reductase
MSPAAGRLPAASTVVTVSQGDRLDLATVLDGLRRDGHGVILTEGGPTLIGSLLRDRLLDELFLTLSPVLAGRNGHDQTRRLGLVEGVAMPGDGLLGASLSSVRREGSHLFLRHALG